MHGLRVTFLPLQESGLIGVQQGERASGGHQHEALRLTSCSGASLRREGSGKVPGRHSWSVKCTKKPGRDTEGREGRKL